MSRRKDLSQKEKTKNVIGKLLEIVRQKWSEKIKGNLPPVDWKHLLMLNIPYVIVFYLVDKVAWLYRYCIGDSLIEKLGVLFLNFSLAFQNFLPSFHPQDLLVGVTGAALVKLAVYLKGKNAKKYRKGVEYGSARWSA